MSRCKQRVRLFNATPMCVIVLLACSHALYGADVAQEYVAQARRILDETGIRGGLIVHVGCEDGHLTAALHVDDSYLVHGLETDPAQVVKAREHIRSLGIYGAVSVERYGEKYLPYTDNLVNLIVSEELGDIPMEEVRRVLAPQGVGFIKKDGQWTKVIKPRPSNIDEWTHALHDADNNAVADDDVVGPPHHLQWTTGPKWARSHDHLSSVSALVSSGSRIFSIVDEGPIAFVALPGKWRLVARDAFNGVLLWKRPIEPWEGHLRGFRSGPPDLSRRLVAIGDRVYVTLGYEKPLTALDAATGKTLKTYDETEGTLEVLYHNGVLFVITGDRAAEEKSSVSWRRGVTPPPHNKRIMALHADTGDILWVKSGPAITEVMPTTLAVQGERVFFQNTNHVICLDRNTGNEVWQAERPIARTRLGWSTPTLVVYEDVVLSADRARPTDDEKKSESSNKLEWDPSSAGGRAPVGELVAFSAKTGEKLWACPCREGYNSPVDVLVAGGLVWTGDLVKAGDPGITQARNPKTGEVEKTRPTDEAFFRVGMTHHRCYRNKATNRFLILGRAGIEFIDVATGRGVADHWVRGTCQYGVMPCNGLLYAPQHSCACYIEAKLNGFNALAPKCGLTPDRSETENRLEQGPAYGKASDSPTAAPSDWPTYRHDAARSGHTESTVPEKLTLLWNHDLGGRLSSPVVAAGKVFVSAVDSHTLHALDAETGKGAWSYTVGGRVDSPPAIHKGLVLFGSADGWVYCIRVSDGQLVWRFRAAPQDRRIVAYEQLESAWPVHGSILVQNHVAYFVAGRSAFLDGGMHLYRLNALTGEMLSQTRIDSRDPKSSEEPQDIIERVNMLGSLPDVLSSDGQSVFMRHTRFDLKGVPQKSDIPHLYSSVGFLDDSWWHRTYWIIGTYMGSGYGGWLRTGNVVPAGRLLAFDESIICGFARNRYAHHGSHVGLDASTVFHFKPKRDTGTRYTRYRLFGMSRTDETQGGAPAPPPRKPGMKRKRGQGANPAKTYLWSSQVPLLVRAMVLADKTLFVAGPPEVSDSDEPTTAFDEHTGGLLRAVSTTDGQKLAEHTLDAPPVFDGMIAANGRLYLSTIDGRISCLGGNLK